MTQPHAENNPLGEALLGMEHFSATRARRYREEMDQLLAHRVSPADRWTTGVAALLIGPALVILGTAIAFSRSQPDLDAFEEGKLFLAWSCIATGLLFGAWLLYISIRGNYTRKLGDIVGLAIVLILSGGWALAMLQIALDTKDPLLRYKLLTAAAVLVTILLGALLVALLQRMHRQTQQKLLRIEYHLAELMERSTPNPSRAPL